MSSYKKMIAPLLTTMWDHTDGCTNQYRCASAVYLISCIALEFSVINYKSLGASVHGKDFFDSTNARYRSMLKL